MSNHKPFLPSELIVDQQQRIYHLGLTPEQIADKIILVGDQKRVELIASFLTDVDVNVQHREFHTIRGRYKNKTLLVVSTGIGTDNVDIVLNELDALANIDFGTRQSKSTRKQLEFVRIGTCGLLNSNAPVGSYALSEAAIGLDNLAHFYDYSADKEANSIEEELLDRFSMPKKVLPYCSIASQALTNRFDSASTLTGITLTAPGFYGPQGRSLNAPLASKNFIDELENAKLGGKPLLNFEMESSALFFLSNLFNHKATTICLGIANRPTGQFLPTYQTEMKGLIAYVLDRF